MKHLYNLADEYNALIALLDNEESDNEELTSQLTQITSEFNDKVENIGKLVLSLQADSKAIKAEEERLSKRRNAVDSKVDWLKDYLKQELINTKKNEVKGELLTVSLRKNPASVKVINEDEISKEYKRHIPEEWQVDKKNILSLFKDEKIIISEDGEHIVNASTGEIINGFEIITDAKSLSIR